MRRLSRRVMRIYGLMLASAALGMGKAPSGVAEACAQCVSNILCEGGKPSGYTSCRIEGANPCKVAYPFCGS